MVLGSPADAKAEGCLSASVVNSFDDSNAALPSAGTSDGTDNLTLQSNTKKSAPFEAEGDFNSDLAFENGFAYGGNYDGVQIWDVRGGKTPTLASAIHCPGSQNDVTVNDGILVTSTDSRRTDDACGSTSTTTPGDPSTWEGLKVFDVRDPYHPEYLTSVFTDCGSHTHTVLPQRDRLLIYVQSYDIVAGRYRCEGPHDKISIVSVPRKDPSKAKVVSVIDWTNPRDIREVAWFDRGPIDETKLVLGGFWSSYYYSGRIYGSEIQRGFDVLKLDGFDRQSPDTLNAQTQERF
jgi:hypothetical protein